MSIAAGYTDEEVRAIVYEYERLPYGEKIAWLHAQGMSRGKHRRWRDAVFEGDLARGLIPRESSDMTAPHQRRRISNMQEREATENERLRARIRELEATNEALGKAIGLLHQLNEQGVC